MSAHDTVMRSRVVPILAEIRLSSAIVLRIKVLHFWFL